MAIIYRQVPIGEPVPGINENTPIMGIPVVAIPTPVATPLCETFAIEAAKQGLLGTLVVMATGVGSLLLGAASVKSTAPCFIAAGAVTCVATEAGYWTYRHKQQQAANAAPLAQNMI